MIVELAMRAIVADRPVAIDDRASECADFDILGAGDRVEELGADAASEHSADEAERREHSG